MRYRVETVKKLYIIEAHGFFIKEGTYLFYSINDKELGSSRYKTIAPFPLVNTVSVVGAKDESET